MIGKIKNQIDIICSNCGSEIVVYELNDGSPLRNYDCALCPTCGKKIHEDYIVGGFVSELKTANEIK